MIWGYTILENPHILAELTGFHLQVLIPNSPPIHHQGALPRCRRVDRAPWCGPRFFGSTPNGGEWSEVGLYNLYMIPFFELTGRVGALPFER